MKRHRNLYVILGLFPVITLAQQHENDLVEINELTADLYGSISFDNSKFPDLEDTKALYYEQAWIGAVDTSRVRMYPATEFEQKNHDSFVRNKVISFQEREIKGITHIYGGVAMRFSSYEYVLRTEKREIKTTGVNSIQLVKVPDLGWRIHSILFSDDHTYGTLPPQYSKNE